MLTCRHCGSNGRCDLDSFALVRKGRLGMLKAGRMYSTFCYLSEWVIMAGGS